MSDTSAANNPGLFVSLVVLVHGVYDEVFVSQVEFGYTVCTGIQGSQFGGSILEAVNDATGGVVQCGIGCEAVDVEQLTGEVFVLNDGSGGSVAPRSLTFGIGFFEVLSVVRAVVHQRLPCVIACGTLLGAETVNGSCCTVDSGHVYTGSFLQGNVTYEAAVVDTAGVGCAPVVFAKCEVIDDGAFAGFHIHLIYALCVASGGLGILAFACHLDGGGQITCNPYVAVGVATDLVGAKLAGDGLALVCALENTLFLTGKEVDDNNLSVVVGAFALGHSVRPAYENLDVFVLVTQLGDTSSTSASTHLHKGVASEVVVVVEAVGYPHIFTLEAVDCFVSGPVCYSEGRR